jgi:hypothetical protein
MILLDGFQKKTMVLSILLLCSCCKRMVSLSQAPAPTNLDGSLKVPFKSKETGQISRVQPKLTV